MNKKISGLIELARLDKPIGVYLLLWPSLLGLLLAGFEVGSLNFKNFIIVILGSVLVRSCGCVINDISDFKIDKLVTRTVGRPLATGSITIFEAWVFFIVLGSLSVALLVFTNTLTLKISLFFALLIMVYPLTKRFFPAPQFVLGITFGSGSLIAYSLQSDIFSFSLVILYLGIVSWIIGFDTLYAMEDKEDDIKININSTAILWGDNAAKYAQILHLVFFASLLIIAMLNKFSFYFIFVFIGHIVVYFYQKILIKKLRFLQAFKVNNWIGIIAVSGFLFEFFQLA
mgnify:FL=1